MRTAQKVRVYVLTRSGSQERLNVLAGHTNYLLERILELREGQKLTIRAAGKRRETIDAMKNFGGW